MDTWTERSPNSLKSTSFDSNITTAVGQTERGANNKDTTVLGRPKRVTQRPGHLDDYVTNYGTK
jgi:hypothetical protein